MEPSHDTFIIVLAFPLEGSMIGELLVNFCGGGLRRRLKFDRRFRVGILLDEDCSLAPA